MQENSGTGIGWKDCNGTAGCCKHTICVVLMSLPYMQDTYCLASHASVRCSKTHLNRCDLSSVIAVMIRDCRPVAYLWSSSCEEIMPARWTHAVGLHARNLLWTEAVLTGQGSATANRLSLYARELRPAHSGTTRTWIPPNGLAKHADGLHRHIKRRACDILRVGGGAGAAAVDVGRDVVDLLAVLVGDGGARRRPRVRAQHHAVLRAVQVSVLAEPLYAATGVPHTRARPRNSSILDDDDR